MFENYLQYHHIPCGAVIGRIMSKEHLTQRELANRAGIPYQRINDFIANRRKISPEVSLKLEKALNIDNKCFFYQIQTNHEIFTAIMQLSEKHHPNLSKFRKALFWDTDFNNIDWNKNSKWVIKRVFEYGNDKEIKETIKFYGRDSVTNTLLLIHDSWNAKNRYDNLKKYLNYDIGNLSLKI